LLKNITDSMTCCCSGAVKGLHNFIHKSWKLQSVSLKISHSFHCYWPRKQIWDMSGEPIYLEPWKMLYTTRSLRLMTVQFAQWEHGYTSRVRHCTDKASTHLFIVVTRPNKWMGTLWKNKVWSQSIILHNVYTLRLRKKYLLRKKHVALLSGWSPWILTHMHTHKHKSHTCMHTHPYPGMHAYVLSLSLSLDKF
jgi:hypothetical protein